MALEQESCYCTTMFQDLDLPGLMAGRAVNDNPEPSRRQYPRRTNDKCALKVEGKLYPVKDWSKTGVLIDADGRLFNENNTLSGELLFYIPGEVIVVPLTMDVIRASATLAAFSFQTLAPDTYQQFARVIEDQFHQAMLAAQTQQ